MRKEETIDYHIKSCWHSISRIYNQKAQIEGITGSMGFVLININSSEGTAATKIAPMMGLESRSLTRILKAMEQKQLIEKHPDTKDGRSVRIFLTPAGREKKMVAVKTIKEFNEKIRDALTDEEINSFFKLFEKIHSVIGKIEK